MTSPESYVPIGRVLKQIRQTRGLTQVELARRTGIDHRTITAIETGRILNPSLFNLKRLTQSLGITLKELFARTEAEEISSLFIGTQKGEYQTPSTPFHRS